MTIPVSLLLLLNALFNVVTWPTFYRRVARDPRARDAAGKPTKFLTVHVVLVSISMVLGAATAVIGVMGLLG